MKFDSHLHDLVRSWFKAHQSKRAQVTEAAMDHLKIVHPELSSTGRARHWSMILGLMRMPDLTNLTRFDEEGKCDVAPTLAYMTSICGSTVHPDAVLLNEGRCLEVVVSAQQYSHACSRLFAYEGPPTVQFEFDSAFYTWTSRALKGSLRFMQRQKHTHPYVIQLTIQAP